MMRFIKVVSLVLVLVLAGCGGLPNVLPNVIEKYEGGRNAHGEPHGQGVMTMMDGARYEGEWFEGKAHGHFVGTKPDGWRY